MKQRSRMEAPGPRSNKAKAHQQDRDAGKEKANSKTVTQRSENDEQQECKAEKQKVSSRTVKQGSKR